VSELLYFEEFEVGQVFALGPFDVTAADIMAFARAFDPQPFHLDVAAARNSILGGLAASGWHTSSILLRLICDAFLSRSAVHGSSGMDEVKWLKPVLADDVLSGRFEITGLRRSASRKSTGIMNFTARLEDHNGERKIEMKGMFFMGCRTP
jgi:acyl dehydratase